MDVALRVRWFWFLAGDLERAALTPARRSFHRRVAWATALAADGLLLAPDAPFPVDAPRVPHEQLVTFLRRLRWLMLWQVCSDANRAAASAVRRANGARLFREVVELRPETDDHLYPVALDEIQPVTDLFRLFGGPGHLPVDPYTNGVEACVEASVAEDLWAYDLTVEWWGDISFLAPDIDAGAQIPPLLPHAAAKEALTACGVADAELGFGLDGRFDKAKQCGPVTCAVSYLIELEGLTAAQVAALEADCVRTDCFGPSILCAASISPLRRFLGPRHRRVSPFTAASVASVAGSTAGSGPLFTDARTGRRLSASAVAALYAAGRD